MYRSNETAIWKLIEREISIPGTVTIFFKITNVRAYCLPLFFLFQALRHWTDSFTGPWAIIFRRCDHCRCPITQTPTENNGVWWVWGLPESPGQTVEMQLYSDLWDHEVISVFGIKIIIFIEKIWSLKEKSRKWIFRAHPGHTVRWQLFFFVVSF